MLGKLYKTPRKIPELLEKTLVICMAHQFAKAYRLHLREMEELEDIRTEDTEYSYTDKEGFSFIQTAPAAANRTGQGTVPGSFENDKDHYMKVFLNFFAKELTRLFEAGNYDRIVIFVPDDMKHITEEKLRYLSDRVEFIYGNFTKHQPLELVEKIYHEKFYLFPLEKTIVDRKN